MNIKHAVVVTKWYEPERVLEYTIHNGYNDNIQGLRPDKVVVIERGLYKVNLLIKEEEMKSRTISVKPEDFYILSPGDFVSVRKGRVFIITEL